MKKILFTLGLGIFFAAAHVSFAGSYVDVGLTDKYEPGIKFVTQEGIVSGYEDGSYKPDSLLNRAELSKILAEAFYTVSGDFEDYDDQCFSDVAPGAWYTKYVCFLKINGVVSGYSDGTFRPGQPINLVETLKMVLDIFEVEYKKVDPWYQDIVKKAVSGNFISLDFTSFGQNVTRGQMADIVARVMKYMQYNVDNNYSALDDYLGFLKDYKVTYETLEDGENVEKEARDFDRTDDAVAIQFEVVSDSSKYQIAVYSYDAVEDEEVSCSQGYYSGNFVLSMISVDKKGVRDQILNEVDLGYRTLSSVGATHFIDMSYGEISLLPVILLEEYGDCNGNLFTFFRPSGYYENFQELEFDNLLDNKVYASSFEDFEFNVEAFDHTYYNNAKQKNITEIYYWDEDLGCFVWQDELTKEEDLEEDEAAEPEPE